MSARSRCARNPLRARLHLREAATPEPINAKPAEAAGLHSPAKPGSSICLATTSFPEIATFSQAPILATGEVRPGQPLPGGLRCNPGGPFALIRPCHLRPVPPAEAPPALGDAMPCQLRRPCRALLPEPAHASPLHAGISKSAAGRDLAELTRPGCITRKRRPGGVYVYRIARRFLPQWAKEQVSQAWDRQREARRARRAERAARGVPEPGTEEKPDKKNQGDARARAGFADAK